MILFTLFELDFHGEVFAGFLGILSSLLEGFICPFMFRPGNLVHFPVFFVLGCIDALSMAAYRFLKLNVVCVDE
jgi:hypothetical protein